MPNNYLSDEIMSSYTCFSYKIVIREDQWPGEFPKCQSLTIFANTKYHTHLTKGKTNAGPLVATARQLGAQTDPTVF